MGATTYDYGPMADAHERPITERDELLEPFREACKPRARWRIGTEAEKAGVQLDTLRPVPYGGPRGIGAVLERLASRHGWSPEPEVQGGPIIALRRGDASVTLEPGGQLELSGAPLPTIHMICAEFHQHMSELEEPSEELGIAWLGVGFQPLATREDYEWVPKLRYGVMREYLPTRGGHALDMMLRTCTVQANFDYDSEQTAVVMVRVACAASPFVTAMFANSPFVEGKPSGYASFRSRVWLDVDPDRSGIPEMVCEPGFGFARWAEWALDVPMFLLKRDGKVVRNTGQTFRDFLANGFEGHRATMSDWEMHLNTLFPEVRLKRTIEVRGADGVPTPLICALPGFWKGILYDPKSLAAAGELLEGITATERAALRVGVPRTALATPFRAGTVGDVARKLLDLSVAGLQRLGCLSRDRRDESIHLARLRELVDANQCPADVLLAEWRARGQTREAIVAAARL